MYSLFTCISFAQFCKVVHNSTRPSCPIGTPGKRSLLQICVSFDTGLQYISVGDFKNEFISCSKRVYIKIRHNLFGSTCMYVIAESSVEA